MKRCIWNYFQINYLNPGSLGTGGGSGGFNSNQRAIIGIKPPTSAVTYDMRLYASVTPSASSISYGQSFTVSTNIANFGTNSFTGDYCAAIFDNSYNFVGYVDSVINSTIQGGYHYTNGFTFSNSGSLSMLPGTYYIGIFYHQKLEMIQQRQGIIPFMNCMIQHVLLHFNCLNMINFI